MRKIIAIIALAMVMIFSFGGCEDKSDERLSDVPKNCEVIIETTLYGKVKDRKDYIAVCNSLDEFKETSLKNGYYIFDGSQEYAEIANKLKGYDEEYFKDKAFLVCAYYKSSYAGQYHINGVERTEDKLTLYIKYPGSNNANDVINNVFFIAGVDKSLVSEIKEIDYVLI